MALTPITNEPERGQRSGTRTPAQRAASRVNGARSAGPITEWGKSISSKNSISTGVAARCVLLAGETIEEHQAQLDAWLVTLSPTSPGAALLVARISDGFIRLGRIDRQAEAVVDAGVEAAVKKTEAWSRLSRISDAREAVGSMADTAGGITQPVPFEDVRKLAPAMRRVLEMVEDAEVPVSLLVRLREATEVVLASDLLDVGEVAFKDLAVTARDVEGFLFAAAAVARAEIERERKQLALDPTLGNEAELKRLDRYRARTLREIERYLKLLREVRAMESATGSPSGSVVHVKLVALGAGHSAEEEVP